MSSQSVGRLDWRNLAQSNQPFSPVKTWEVKGDDVEFTIKLPGFSRDRLRINLSVGSRILIVMGQRSDGFNVTRLNERISIREDCLLDGVRAQFVDDTLIVIFPKKK